MHDNDLTRRLSSRSVAEGDPVGRFERFYAEAERGAAEVPWERAIPAVGRLVAPGGTLLVIAAGRRDGEQVDGPPWPLTRTEVDAFASGPLTPAGTEEIVAPDGGLRWRAEFHRAR